MASAGDAPDRIVWPSWFAPPASVGAVLAGLDRSQWETPAQIAAGRRRQLVTLVRHAAARAPLHARLADHVVALESATDEAFDARWRELPILVRAELRAQARELVARRIPPDHLPVGSVHSSGSTGVAVEVLSTAATRLAFDALTLREHAWQRRDFTQRFGVMRYLVPERRDPHGTDMPSWGNPVASLHATGPASAIHIGYPIDVLAAWLRRFDPHVLLTYPSVVAPLIDALGAKPPALAEIRCMAEPLDVSLEGHVEGKWGVRCTDVYSANEAGTIAFRCREHASLHTQDEHVFVEVLDDAGAPCAPGTAGRVVVTDLQNYAMPLIRYELGDYATRGAPCPCGRGLGVLERVHGRVRNLVRMPDGRRAWPVALGAVWAVRAIRQAQFVQTALDRIELRVVVERPLAADERALAIEKTRSALGYPFDVDVREVERIERGPTGKFEEFLSLISS